VLNWDNILLNIVAELVLVRVCDNSVTRVLVLYKFYINRFTNALVKRVFFRFKK
jgi:hypothetical protein